MANQSLRSVIVAALCSTLSALAGAANNDTGQTLCYDAANVAAPCSAAVGGDAGVNPRQDGRYGRDAAAVAGQLTKIGAGAAGFDYTKIANNGSVLPATSALGNAATDWACTKDNVTGFIWEVKTANGLRSSAHTYTWYSTDAASNGGDVGSVGIDTCGGSLGAYRNQCNTQNYAVAVNAAGGLCGATDWRLPTQRELLTLVHAGNASPAIDSTYFPNTVSNFYWSKSTYAVDSIGAWIVVYDVGYTIAGAKFLNVAARLVRSEP